MDVPVVKSTMIEKDGKRYVVFPIQPDWIKLDPAGIQQLADEGLLVRLERTEE